MEREICKPNGDVYFTVKYDGKLIKLDKFGDAKLTLRFDARALDQLLEALEEVKLLRFVGGKK